MFGSDLHDKILTASYDTTVYFGIREMGPKVSVYFIRGIRDYFALFPWYEDLYGFPDRVPFFENWFRYDDVDENF